MTTQDIKDEIHKSALLIRELHTEMHAKHKLREESPEAVQAWHAAAELFRERFNSLAFPGGYHGALERLLAGDAFAMEAAICFLEIRPFFFHSGFMFKDLLRKARKAPLTELQKQRLHVIEEAVVNWRTRKHTSAQGLR